MLEVIACLDGSKDHRWISPNLKISRLMLFLFKIKGYKFSLQRNVESEFRIYRSSVNGAAVLARSRQRAFASLRIAFDSLRKLRKGGKRKTGKIVTGK